MEVSFQSSWQLISLLENRFRNQRIRHGTFYFSQILVAIVLEDELLLPWVLHIGADARIRLLMWTSSGYRSNNSCSVVLMRHVCVILNIDLLLLAAQWLFLFVSDTLRNVVLFALYNQNVLSFEVEHAWRSQAKSIIVVLNSLELVLVPHFVLLGGFSLAFKGPLALIGWLHYDGRGLASTVDRCKLLWCISIHARISTSGHIIDHRLVLDKISD